jgi:hypothetical protein
MSAKTAIHELIAEYRSSVWSTPSGDRIDYVIIERRAIRAIKLLVSAMRKQ